MPNGVLSVVGSYDFFGKSIPGAVLLLGFGSLLPQSVLNTVERGSAPAANQSLFAVNTMVDLIALGLVILTAGVIIGQGVHTLAILIENTVYWFGNRLSGTWNVAVDFYGSFSPNIIPRAIAYVRNRISSFVVGTYCWFIASKPIEYVTSLSVYAGIRGWISRLVAWEPGREFLAEIALLGFVVKTNWVKGIQRWYSRKYWGINDTFKSHRLLFGEEISWYLSRYVARRNSDQYHVTKDRFIRTAKERYDLNDADFSNRNQLYPLVVSELVSGSVTRAESMQARYSFCRGMWVVCFVTGVTYTLVLAGYLQPLRRYGLWSPEYTHLFHEYPLILSLFSGQSPVSVLVGGIVLLGIGTVVFMAGAAQYKKNYIEYIFAEYYILHNG